jgi:hypothetical protein
VKPDPLQGFTLSNPKCRSCGAGLKVVDQGEAAPHRWILYHDEPVCSWFGEQRAKRLGALQNEKQNDELERRAAAARAQIDAAVKRRKK